MSAPRARRPVGVVAAVSPEGVIGRDGGLPWRRPADLRRFKELTLGGTIVMGRRTYASMGRPLPGRVNVVLTRGSDLPGVLVAGSLEEALHLGHGPTWVIGGAEPFAEALGRLADHVDLTYVPDHVPVEGSVLFPPMDPERWIAGPLLRNAEDPSLYHRRFWLAPTAAPRPEP